MHINLRRAKISYIIHNITSRTIILSDLRAEIGPHKMLDLERVAERAAIDRSHDLRLALDTKRVRLCSDGVVSKTVKPEIQIVEKIIEKHHHHEVEHHHHEEKSGLDEARLIEMMKQVMQENQPAPAPADSNKAVLDAMAALQQQIKSMGGEDASDLMPSIDPVKLAELQAKAIDKMSKDMETGNKKTGRKVILKNTRLGDLADELD